MLSTRASCLSQPFLHRIPNFFCGCDQSAAMAAVNAPVITSRKEGEVHDAITSYNVSLEEEKQEDEGALDRGCCCVVCILAPSRP